MKLRRSRLLFSVAVLALVPLFGPAASMQQAPKRPIEVADVVAWKTLGATVLSNDGQWFGYRVAPQEGDAEVVVKRVRGEKEMRFPIGEQPQGGPAAAAVAARPPVRVRGAVVLRRLEVDRVHDESDAGRRRSGCGGSAGRSSRASRS